MSQHLMWRAPGKVVLLGEYAVLEGALGLVAAVQRFATVQARPSRLWRVSSPHMDLREVLLRVEAGRVAVEAPLQARLALVAACVEEVLRLDPKLPPLHLRIDSAPFSDRDGRKLGLGSSGAVAVALSAALLAQVGRPGAPLQAQAFELARRAHRAAQKGLGSGIDIAASAHGGILVFRQRGDTVEVEPSETRATFACIDTGVAASTPRLVRGVLALGERAPARYRELMGRLSEVSERGCAAWQRGAVESFAAAVDEYGRGLYDLGEASGVAIWSDEHLRIRKIVQDLGGVYKPSGAGGGDLGVAVPRTKVSSKAWAARLVSAQLHLLRIRIGERGLHSAQPPP